jgi:uncharacterized protein (DUF952 family)
LSSLILAASVDFIRGREMTLVYKICRAHDWRHAVMQGTYDGSEHDRRDGFIHLSAVHQLRDTAARHFAGQSDLVLVAFDTARLEPSLRWELSRGGDLFPHVYGSIATKDALWAKPLPWRDDEHDFPPGVVP